MATVECIVITQLIITRDVLLNEEPRCNAVNPDGRIIFYNVEIFYMGADIIITSFVIY